MDQQIPYEAIRQISELAKRYSTWRANSEQLFTENSRFDPQKIGDLKSEYGNASPQNAVNYCRRLILEFLLQGNVLTLDAYKTIQEKVVSDSGTDFPTLYKNPFSVLYPFLRANYENSGRQNSFENTLKDLGERIRRELEIADYTTQHVVDFRGARKLGADRVWLVIYNKIHESHQAAMQFMFHLDVNGLYISLYNRPQNLVIDSLKLDTESEWFEQLMEFFRPRIEKIRENNPRHEAFDEVDGTYRPGQKIFKLSHGAAYFNDEEIEKLQKEGLAVIHEEVSYPGQGQGSPFNDLFNAKPGDWVYICRGNQYFVLLGQFLGNNKIPDVHREASWKGRRLRVYKAPLKYFHYEGTRQAWTPNNPTTFWEIPNHELKNANAWIFGPYFGVEFTAEGIVELSPDEIKQAQKKQKKEAPENEALDQEADLNTDTEAGNLTDPDTNKNIRQAIDPYLTVSEVEAMDGTDTTARYFAQMLNLMRDPEEGQLAGIFGNWGRGKTYFMNKVIKELEANEELCCHKRYAPWYWSGLIHGLWKQKKQLTKLKHKINQQKKESEQQTKNKNPSANRMQKPPDYKYHIVRFNAWEYQHDRHGVWASIYTQLQDDYHRLAGNSWIRKKLLTLMLNKTQSWVEILFTSLLVLSLTSLITYFLFNYQKLNEETLKWLIGSSGLIFLIQQLKAFASGQSLLQHLSNWYQHRFKPNNYEKEKGFQFEIKQKISTLFEVWFGLSECYWPRNYQRVLIFVDDIDRCEAQNMIRVIDDIRLIFTNNGYSDLNDKLVVVAAIDLKILKPVIAEKYRFLFQNHESGEHNNPKSIDLEQKENEYLEKLFLYGINLARLTEVQRINMTNIFFEHLNLLPDLENTTDTEKTVQSAINETPTGGTEGPVNFGQIQNNPGEIKKIEFYGLEQHELDRFRKIFKDCPYELTPRTMRIWLIRFTLIYNLYPKLTNANSPDPELATEILNRLRLLITEKKSVDELDFNNNQTLEEVFRLAIPWHLVSK